MVTHGDGLCFQGTTKVQSAAHTARITREARPTAHATAATQPDCRELVINGGLMVINGD